MRAAWPGRLRRSGSAIAYIGVWLLDGAVPPDDVPYYIHWEISPRVIAYTIAIVAR